MPYDSTHMALLLCNQIILRPGVKNVQNVPIEFAQDFTEMKVSCLRIEYSTVSLHITDRQIGAKLRLSKELSMAFEISHHITKVTWCYLNAFSQYHCSFQMKAALPLAKSLVARNHIRSPSQDTHHAGIVKQSSLRVISSARGWPSPQSSACGEW